MIGPLSYKLDWGEKHGFVVFKVNAWQLFMYFFSYPMSASKVVKTLWLIRIKCYIHRNAVLRYLGRPLSACSIVALVVCFTSLCQRQESQEAGTEPCLTRVEFFQLKTLSSAESRSWRAHWQSKAIGTTGVFKATRRILPSREQIISFRKCFKCTIYIKKCHHHVVIGYE